MAKGANMHEMRRKMRSFLPFSFHLHEVKCVLWLPEMHGSALSFSFLSGRVFVFILTDSSPFFFSFELWILSASSGVYSTCRTCTPAYTNTHIPIHIYIYARWGNLISHAELPSPPPRPEKKEVRERSRPLSRPTGTLPTHTHKKEPFVLDCLFII